MCKLKQCKCSKTFSKFNGDLEKGLCFTCIEKQTSEATKKRQLSEYMSNVKKKPRNNNKLEKIASIEG